MKFKKLLTKFGSAFATTLVTVLLVVVIDEVVDVVVEITVEEGNVAFVLMLDRNVVVGPTVVEVVGSVFVASVFLMLV